MVLLLNLNYLFIKSIFEQDIRTVETLSDIFYQKFSKNG